MHISSMLRMEWFVKNYVEGGKDKKILDIGSYSVNGSYRDLLKDIDIKYVGLDVEDGPNVDVVMDEVYNWTSIENESFDYIISGQAFEHIEYPWMTIKEIYKKLKENGIICIIAPSAGPEHKYPKDCYRYYNDGLTAIVQWGGFKVLDVSTGGIPDRTVSDEWDSHWNDICIVAYKPGKSDCFVEKKRLFPLERRFEPANDLMMHYEFLAKWMKIQNKDQVIKEYLQIQNCSKICVYGYEHIGKNLAKVLERMNIEYEVVEEKKNCYNKRGAGDRVADGSGIYLADDEKMLKCIGTNTLMVITIFDHSRDYIHYIDKVYPNCPKCYLYDIFDYMFLKKLYGSDKKVYLYGAGKYGKLVYDRIKNLGFEIEGFIVSDGRKDREYYCNRMVFELRDIEKSARIIISIDKRLENEILNNLNDKGFEYGYLYKEYLNIYD